MKTLLDPHILQRIMDKVPAAVALYSITSGNYLYVNQALKDILGYDPEQFINGGVEFVAGLVHPDDIGPLLRDNQAAVEAANRDPQPASEPTKSFVYRIKHKNGSWRWIQTEGTVMQRSASGMVETILNVSLDVTDYKNLEHRLTRSLHLLEETLKAEPH